MKYTFSETEERMWLGHTLHKVIYDAEWLKENEIDEEDTVGGWIENEKNLSQNDMCMVTDDAMVYGNARVYDNAIVCGEARVSQSYTMSLKISSTKQWFEYQLEKIKLQEKWDAEEKAKGKENAE